MSVNISNYELALAKKLNQVSLTTEDELLYAQAIKKAQVGAVFTVTTFSELPSISTVPAGSLYYVDNERGHYVSDGTYWRLLNNDLNKFLWVWGCNETGQLGDGTTINKSSPISIISGNSSWCQISSGRGHVIGVLRGCSVWTWGYNAGGALGDGTAINKSSPVSVIGGFTDWCWVSASPNQSFAFSAGIRTNGELWTWGNGQWGKLGDGCTINRSSPVSVIGGYTWCRVSAGNGHTVAIRNDGTIWGWGKNEDGQLGDSSSVCKSSPVSVVGGITNWCQIIAGGNNLSAAIRSNCTLWVWGRNDAGDLGDGTTVKKSSPITPIGGFADWCQVSAGPAFVTAIRTNGTIWAWGDNSNGRLGDGTTTNKSSPVSVIGGFTNWCQVAAGNNSVVALRADGTLWTWGAGSSGKLGDGTTVDKCSPVSVIGGFTNWQAVSAADAGFALR